MNRWYAGVVMGLCLLVIGCSEKAPEKDAGVAAIENGGSLFDEYCDSCHPRTGRGDYLKLIPASLLARRSELELTSWILGSENHREMPNFDNLTERQRKDLASFLLDQIGK